MVRDIRRGDYSTARWPRATRGRGGVTGSMPACASVASSIADLLDAFASAELARQEHAQAQHALELAVGGAVDERVTRSLRAQTTALRLRADELLRRAERLLPRAGRLQ